MLNTINVNKTRFCNLFNSTKKGRVTFQILQDEYLRDVYCENCNTNKIYNATILQKLHLKRKGIYEK